MIDGSTVSKGREEQGHLATSTSSSCRAVAVTQLPPEGFKEVVLGETLVSVRVRSSRGNSENNWKVEEIELLRD